MEKSRNFAFTLNNYTQDDLDKLQRIIQEEATVKYLVYGKEIGDAGTPHLQGFIRFANPRKFDSVKSLISERSHLEVARSPVAAARYCKKDGDFYEFGTSPEISRQGQGKRTDLQRLVESVGEGETCRKKLRSEFPEVSAKYPHFVTSIILDQLPVPELETFPLRPWQQRLTAKLKLPPDNRKIIFVVDPRGNAGKSWYCEYHALTYGNSVALLPGKKADMLYEFIHKVQPDTKTIFLDCPRSKQEDTMQYDLLEQFKNGRIFSTKYECRGLRFYTPHVVVMLNREPDRLALSEDRYDILYVGY